MAVPLMNNGRETIFDYLWDGLREDPYDEGPKRLHEVAKVLRAEESDDWEDEADDLDDAADELDALFSRIFDTVEDDIGYGVRGGSERYWRDGRYDEQIAEETEGKRKH